MPGRTNRSSRRALLSGATGLAAAGVLGACTVRTETAWQSGPPHPLLPSPVPAGAAPERATPVPGGLELEGFLALSSVLTGFEELNPALGRVYLLSLETGGDGGATLGALYEQAGFGGQAPPATVEDLEAAGVFDQEQLRTLADTIITYWYTGVYDVGGEQVVATYVDALAWQAIGYVKPRSICGPYPGFWRERPPVIP